MGNNTISHRLSSLIPERLREARLARGYTIVELAEAIGVTRQAVSQYELGHSAPSGQVLAKLVETLDLPLSYFTNPVKYRNVPEGAIFFRCLKSATKRPRDMLSVRVGWLEDIYLYLQQYVDFPKVNIPNYSYGDGLDNDTIEDIALSLRKAWGLGLGPISNVILLLEKQGVIISRISFDDVKTDGFSQWRGERPFIFLGSDKESAVRSRFDAVHELGHLLLHMWIDKEQLSDAKVLNQLEKEANYFASVFLMPRETFCQEVMSTSISHFTTLKRRWKVSIAAMIYRCQDLEILSDSQAIYLWKQMARLKYRKREPLDDEIVSETPGLLKQAITLLVENGVQTASEIVDRIKLPSVEIANLCNVPMEILMSEGKVVFLRVKNNDAEEIE